MQQQGAQPYGLYESPAGTNGKPGTAPNGRIVLSSIEFDTRVKAVESKAKRWYIVLGLVILAALVTYLVILALQAKDSLDNPDVKQIPVSVSSLTFPEILLCPVLGRSITVGTGTCRMEGSNGGKDCGFTTKSLGSMTCYAVNTAGAGVATTTSDILEIAVSVTPIGGVLGYAGLEAFTYPQGKGPSSGNDISKYLATNFVVNKDTTSFVHLKKVVKKDLSGSTTSTSFPLTVSAVNMVNVGASSNIVIRFTFEEIIQYNYEEYWNKDALYVIGAVGGAYSLLRFFILVLEYWRTSRIGKLSSTIEKETHQALLNSELPSYVA
jgi:hypothetical protein